MRAGVHPTGAPFWERNSERLEGDSEAPESDLAVPEGNLAVPDGGASALHVGNGVGTVALDQLPNLAKRLV